MKIINTIEEDYHIHCLQYSDGLSSIDDIIKFGWDIGLKKIAITDHSQISLDHSGIGKKTLRQLVLNRWKNVWNNMEIIFGIEGDLLNEAGDICENIQGREGNFLMLSAHEKIYAGDPKNINKAYENAIIRHHKKINFLGHPCMKVWGDNLDIEKLVSLANEYEIPMEFNCSNFVNGKTDLVKLDVLLKKANHIYVNSDAHTLSELRDNRNIGFEFLKKNYPDLFK